MIVKPELVRKAIEKAIEGSVITKEGKPDKVRKFEESVDIIFNIKDVDYKNPNNRLDVEHLFPQPIRSKGWNTCFFVSGDLEVAAKQLGYTVINKDQLNDLAKKDKKEKKKIVKKYDYFVSEAGQMINVAKVLGRFLGQNGKVIKPKPKGYGVVQPNENLQKFETILDRLVRINMKQPLLQLSIGKKNMDVKDVMENFTSILHRLEAGLPNGTNNIKSIFIKTTMGPSVKVKEPEKRRN